MNLLVRLIVTALIAALALVAVPSTAQAAESGPCPMAIPGDCVPSPQPDPCTQALNELWAEKEDLRVRYEYADQVRAEQYVVMVEQHATIASQAAQIQRLRAKVQRLRDRLQSRR